MPRRTAASGQRRADRGEPSNAPGEVPLTATLPWNRCDRRAFDDGRTEEQNYREDMTYTFWHSGVLIGESELEDISDKPGQRGGTFHPTAYGLEIFPRLSGILSVGR